VNGQSKAIKIIYDKAIELREKPYDIINQDSVEALKREFPLPRTEAIKAEILLGQFVIDMHSLQLCYMEKLITFIENLLDNVEVTEPTTAAKETDNNNIAQQREWFTLSEICDYFHLPMNNVKSKKWRDTNKFPYHQTSGIYGSISYCRSEVEDWLNGKTAAKC
jgi:hypothetical protein